MSANQTSLNPAANKKRSRREKEPSEDEPPSKKGVLQASHLPFVDIPFMIRVQICSYLDLPNLKNLKDMCPEGKETVDHFWKAQRRLVVSPSGLKPYFANVLDNDRFDSIWTIRHELVELFSWLHNSRICELDLRRVKTVNWILFQTIVEDEHGPGTLENALKMVKKLNLEGCYLNSDDLYQASEVLRNIETITLTDRNVTIYEEVDEKDMLKVETRGKNSKKRMAIVQLLKKNFLRLRIVKFY